MGDVDGDGDKEIVLASSQVYVWHHDGLELLDGDGNSQTLGNFTDFPAGTVLQPAAVTLAELDESAGCRDHRLASGHPITDPRLRHDGTELPGWPRRPRACPGRRGTGPLPAVGDIDGDGDRRDRRQYAQRSDLGVARGRDRGARRRQQPRHRSASSTSGPGADWEWSRSGPALYDLDGDGAKDIIFGTKNDATGLRRLMAIRYDGTDVAGFPYVANGAISCEPAVGDLDNDGIVEIVFFCKSTYVYAVRQNGTNYPGFPKFTGV